MTSKQRLLNAFQHKPTDRVPISTYELVGYDYDAWFNKESSYHKLMGYIRENTDCLFMCGCYTGNQSEKLRKTEKKWQEGDNSYTRVTYHSNKGDITALFMKEENIKTTWTIEHLLKTQDDLNIWLSLPYEYKDPDVEKFKKDLEALGDKGVMAVDFADPICVIAELFEFGQGLVQIYTNKKRIIYAMDVIFERQYHALKRALELGYGPTFRLVGAEYATRPYLPTEYFDELVVKYEKQFIDLIHQYNCFARIHCHGRVKEALPLMIKAGADGTDPIEAPPSGDIELAEAKKLYGKELCLFGNIQLKDLEYASPSQMDEIVKKAMDSAKDGGGYVLMPTASPINIPLNPQTEANYFQMIDSALKYGKY